MGIQLHNRRAILKAGSTALALPFLDSLSIAKSVNAVAPKRFLMIGCGYGFTKETFFRLKRDGFRRSALHLALNRWSATETTLPWCRI